MDVYPTILTPDKSITINFTSFHADEIITSIALFKFDAFIPIEVHEYNVSKSGGKIIISFNPFLVSVSEGNYLIFESTNLSRGIGRFFVLDHF